MKKFCALLFFIFLAGVSHAEIFTMERSNKYLSYSISANTVSTNTLIIDLSDTTGYPHKNTKHLTVSSVELDMEKSTGATGTLSLGVITRVDNDNADINYLLIYPFEKTTETSLSFGGSVSPSIIDLKRGYATNVSSSGAAAFQADLSLPTLIGGNSPPSVGDLILSNIRTNSEEINFVLKIFYQSE